MSAVAIPRRIKPHSAASTPARLKTAAWCAIASQVSVVIDLPHSKPPLAASSGARSARPGYGSARLQPNGATGATFAVALLPNPSDAGPTPPPQTAVPAPLRSADEAPRRRNWTLAAIGRDRPNKRLYRTLGGPLGRTSTVSTSSRETSSVPRPPVDSGAPRAEAGRSHIVEPGLSAETSRPSTPRTFSKQCSLASPGAGANRDKHRSAQVPEFMYPAGRRRRT